MKNPFNYTEAFLYYYAHILPRRKVLLSFKDKINNLEKQLDKEVKKIQQREGILCCGAYQTASSQSFQKIELIQEEFFQLRHEMTQGFFGILEKQLSHPQKLDRELMIDNLILFKRDRLDNWFHTYSQLTDYLNEGKLRSIVPCSYGNFLVVWNILDYDYHCFFDEIWTEEFQPPQRYRFRYFIRKTLVNIESKIKPDIIFTTEDC